MYYLIRTNASIAFFKNVTEVYAALKFRPLPSAILYTSDDLEDLRQIAGIVQSRSCDINTQKNNPIERISIPQSITDGTCLAYTPCLKNDAYPENNASLQNALMSNYAENYAVNNIPQGEWAISALNGFCTSPTDEDLCSLLQADSLFYPIANWISHPHEMVVAFARNDYVRRFYSRYCYEIEQTLLPQMFLEYFKDPCFEQREQRLQEEYYKAYTDFQMKRIKFGW